MNRDIEVQKGIPLPPRKGRRGSWDLIASGIQPGDSFAAATRGQADWAIRALRKHGKDGISRAENGGFRVWCVRPVK